MEEVDMRKIPAFMVVAVALLSASTAITAHRESDIQMFPAAERGMQRLVIRMAPRRDEANWRVEFFAGKVMRMDCNITSYVQNMVAHELSGVGHMYWVVDGRADAMSTLMGCPPGSEHMAFASGSPTTQPYNGSLPIVIYAPIGFQVRYRMWNIVSRDIVAPPG
jgi:ecotin